MSDFWWFAVFCLGLPLAVVVYFVTRKIIEESNQKNE
jgi:hypothetical protein